MRYSDRESGAARVGGAAGFRSVAVKRSTFVILVLIAAIALMLARSNPGQSLLNNSRAP